MSAGLASDKDLDYGTDFEDGIPVIAEGTTFNIHGGRDMFKQEVTMVTKQREPSATVK